MRSFFPKLLLVGMFLSEQQRLEEAEGDEFQMLSSVFILFLFRGFPTVQDPAYGMALPTVWDSYFR